MSTDYKKKNEQLKIWIPLFIGISAIVGLFAGYKMSGSDPLDEMFIKVENESVASPGRVEELLRFIESRYVNEIDSDELVAAAFKEVLNHLDPHSIYLEPKELDQLTNQMEGSFEGIGIESLLIEDTLYVNHVIANGPADAVGLKPGDQIIAINDSIIAGNKLEFNQIKSLLKGEKFSHLNLKVLEFPSRSEKIVDLEINQVDVKTVNGFLYDDYAVLCIKRFSADSYREFMHELARLSEMGAFKHLILDLRGNPGGYLPEATKILNQIFKDKGKLLVYTKGKNERTSEYKSTGKNFYDIDKVAILVDEGSASGSEIIAGAVQDWDRGLVIGRRTFGKGLVQEQYALSNGGALRLTVAEYFTPSGRLIQKSYEDRSDYEDDISERINSGELTGDSDVPILDTTAYYTKIKKRKVYAGGGINPDIFVPASNQELSEENIILQSHIPSYVFKLYRKEELQLDDMDEREFIETWSISDQVLKDFKLKFNFGESNSKWIDEHLKTKFKSEVAKLFFGNAVALEIDMRNDDFFNQSLLALGKKNIFASLQESQ